VVSMFILLISPTNGDIHGQNLNDTDKAYNLADFLIHHEQIVHQLWEIGVAGQDLAANVTPKSTSNSDFSNIMLEYTLMNLPTLLRFGTFHDVTRDIVDELSQGFSKSNVSNEEFSKNTSQAILKVLKFVNPVSMLTRSIESAKPVIDQYRHNDSTIFITVLNTVIKYTAYIITTPTFQKVQQIVLEELSAGFQNSNLSYTITHAPKGYIENNTNMIAADVLSKTNIPRMISRSYEAAKPVIDKFYGKDSEYMFGAIVTAFGIGSQVWKNPTFQGFKYRIFQNFMNAYNKSIYAEKGDKFLMDHPVDVYMAVLMQMDYKTLTMEMLNATSKI